VTIINGGDLVASFDVNILGLDPNWVSIFPSQVNLNEGERATVKISFTAPRLPTARAGGYFFSVAISSPDYPGRMACQGGILLVKPYYEFAVGELSPKQQTITWGKNLGRAVVPIINKGNSEAVFRLEVEDDERGCRFEVRPPGEESAQLRQANVQVASDATAEIPVTIIPTRRRLVALNAHTYSYTATVTPLAGQNPPRSLAGQARAVPLIGPWVLALSILLLAALVAVIFRPRINRFVAEHDGQVGDFATPLMIQAGQNVDLSWEAPPFVDLRIDPEVGVVEAVRGSRVVTPTVDTVYTLTATNLLTLLSPQWFTSFFEVPVLVTPIQPTIMFTATVPTGTFNEREATIVRGQAVTLSWEVTFADTLLFLTNGTPETVTPASGFGSRTVTPEQDTTYILRAVNPYTPPDGVSYAYTVRVIEPTPTPLPPPVIQRFDVQPLTVTQGESVRIEWSVTGVAEVTIQGYATGLQPAGSVEVVPAQTTTYILVARTLDGQVRQTQATVTVNPAPTGTPVPQAPRIEFFTATPNQVVQGSMQASAITLAWSVVGETTAIEISGPNINPIQNLGPQGTLAIAASQTTLFILTARNGDLAANQSVAITVLPPPPTATPTLTPVPQPQLSQLSVSAVNPAERNNVSLTSSTATDFFYQVVFDTVVSFSWTSVGSTASSATFEGQPVATTASVTRTINAVSPGIFELRAINSVGATVSYKFHITQVPKTPPVVPGNFTGPPLPVTDPITLTWTYDVPALGSIIGFRVYRTDSVSPLPTLKHEMLLPTPRPTTPGFQWVDPEPNASTPVCGRSYYVVAIYADLGNPTKETAPSNSWNTQPCP
jgi:hypothetical protein